MTTRRHTNDYDCCGFWRDCASGKGCTYGQFNSDYKENMDQYLLHAYKHCTVFKNLYVKKDKDFIEAWEDQIKNPRPITVIPAKSAPKKQSSVLSTLSKLSAEDLLSALQDLDL